MKPSRMSANRAGKNTVTISADTSGLNALFDQWGEELQEAIRPAAYAGIEVVYQEVLSNIRRSFGRKTGRLEQSIYKAFSERNSGPRKATYHVSWRTTRGNGIRAPHAIMLEFDHIQRYATYQARNGEWYTAVRPSMRGKKLPKRATREQKDAYFVPRKGGPAQVAGKRFIRNAVSAFPRALAAAEERLYSALGGRAFT
jgi:hypothetical protein